MIIGEWVSGRKPRTKIEREARDRSEDARSNLCEQHPPGKGWCCTRPAGHKGDHIAAGDELIYCVWEQA